MLGGPVHGLYPRIGIGGVLGGCRASVVPGAAHLGPRRGRPTKVTQVTTHRYEQKSLYAPAFEHDACGIGLVVDLHGRRGHALIAQALDAVEHLAHRGASGAEAATGDGAGMLTQIPHRFLSGVLDFALPEPGRYTPGIVFLPADLEDAAKAERRIEELADEEQLTVLGWRDVPVEPEGLGTSALASMPRMRQVVVACPRESGERAGAQGDPLGLDRLAFCLRKRAEHEVDGVYFASLSAADHRLQGDADLPAAAASSSPTCPTRRSSSGLALVHSRFSTNTFPSWPLAHPYRYLAHNGEINTLAGNRNWMRAREALLRHRRSIPGDLERIFPICTPGASDSASFDEVLELLHLGRALPAPRRADDDPRGLGEPHAPWTRPAGPSTATTPRSWSRGTARRRWPSPTARWSAPCSTATACARPATGSPTTAWWCWPREVGVLDIARRAGRAQGPAAARAGCSWWTPPQGRIVDDDEIKAALAAEHPYGEWLDADQVRLEDLPARDHAHPAARLGGDASSGCSATPTRSCGSSWRPWPRTGGEPIGSMGTDAAIAVLSRPRRGCSTTTSPSCSPR